MELQEAIIQAVRLALDEDLGAGDATTLATVPEAASARAAMVAREPLVLTGLELAEAAFKTLDPAAQLTRLVQDGQPANQGAAVLQVSGRARALLSAERVALNFVQRLSGIATLTAQFVKAVEGTGAKILDTRKTTPGWRRLEKYAVACGGGQNHRLGLFDMVLIKDNHLAALRGERPNPIAAAITRARAQYPCLPIEVEAESLAQVAQALEAGAEFILLDNMTPAQLRAAVSQVAGRARTEASGSITLATVREIAATGVDYVSVGALTHSARAVDLALDWA